MAVAGIERTRCMISSFVPKANHYTRMANASNLRFSCWLCIGRFSTYAADKFASITCCHRIACSNCQSLRVVTCPKRKASCPDYWRFDQHVACRLILVLMMLLLVVTVSHHIQGEVRQNNQFGTRLVNKETKHNRCLQVGQTVLDGHPYPQDHHNNLHHTVNVRKPSASVALVSSGFESPATSRWFNPHGIPAHIFVVDQPHAAFSANQRIGTKSKG